MAKRKRRKRKAGPAPIDAEQSDRIARLEADRDVEALQSAAHGEDRGIRGLARKALHRLREAGVEVPEARQGGRPGWKPSAPALPASVLSAPDPMGNRLVWLLRPGMGGGVTVAQVVIGEEVGVSQLDVVEMSRTRWRDVRSSMDEDQELICAEVSWESAAAAVRDALRKDPEDDSVRQRLADLFPLLGDVEAPAGPHPAYPALGQTPDEGEADGGEELLEVFPVSHWVPPREGFAQLAEGVQQAYGGVLEVTAAQKLEQADAAIDRVVDGFFDGPARARYRRRLEDTAWVLAEMGRKPDASRLLAGARALATDDAASSIPWCRQLFSRWAPEPPSEEPQEPEDERTESGIILP